MAVPKRKTSPMKRGQRRSADALKAPHLRGRQGFRRAAPSASCRSEDRHVPRPPSPQGQIGFLTDGPRRRDLLHSGARAGENPEPHDPGRHVSRLAHRVRMRLASCCAKRRRNDDELKDALDGGRARARRRRSVAGRGIGRRRPSMQSKIRHAFPAGQHLRDERRERTAASAAAALLARQRHQGARRLRFTMNVGRALAHRRVGASYRPGFTSR